MPRLPPGTPLGSETQGLGAYRIVVVCDSYFGRPIRRPSRVLHFPIPSVDPNSGPSRTDGALGIEPGHPHLWPTIPTALAGSSGARFMIPAPSLVAVCSWWTCRAPPPGPERIRSASRNALEHKHGNDYLSTPHRKNAPLFRGAFDLSPYSLAGAAGQYMAEKNDSVGSKIHELSPVCARAVNWSPAATTIGCDCTITAGSTLAGATDGELPMVAAKI